VAAGAFGFLTFGARIAVGQNIVIDLQAGGDVEAEFLRSHARDLMAKGPDIVLGAGGTIVAALQRASRTVSDCIRGCHRSCWWRVGREPCAPPGGNATGFTQFEFGISAKWLELLKEIAPKITRVAVIRDPTARSGGGQLGAIQAVAPSLSVDVKPIDAADKDAIERDLTEFARETNGGLIVTSSRLARAHRELIIALAARLRLPAIYAFRVYVAEGGLMSYGPDNTTPYQRAAGYVDRILKGEKPAELPVQAPTKYELTINLKTAKALGIAVPPSMIARADQVIE
jgi:putative ABC transport system substrate-binding protein